MTDFEKHKVVYETIEAMVGTNWKNSPLGILRPKDKVWEVLDLMADRLNESLTVPVTLIYCADGVAIRPKLEYVKKMLGVKNGKSQ